MSTFTERQEFKLEIIPPFCIIQVREANLVERDGVEVGRTYQRYVKSPGEDVSNEPYEVQAIASTLWTEQLIADYAETCSKTPDTGTTAEPAPDNLSQQDDQPSQAADL
jgi:hypothetical protein